MPLMQIDFSVDFEVPNPDPSVTQQCVNIWYGVETTKNCVTGVITAVNWNRTCGIYPTNTSNTIPLSLTLNDFEASMCSYKLKVVIQPCCFLNGSDCTSSYPNTPSGLVSGTYVSAEKTIYDDTVSPCKRVYIGGHPTTGIIPAGIIRYTPCYETNNALCNNWSYPDTQQSFGISNPIRSIPIGNSTPQSVLNDPSITIIEFCCLNGNVIFEDSSGNPYIAGTDYTIIVEPNLSQNGNKCCHDCVKYAVCNNSSTDHSGIYQDCQTGLLVYVNLPANKYKEACVLAGHVIKIPGFTGGYAVNPSVPLLSGVNIYGLISCNVNVNIDCKYHSPID